MSIPNLSRGYSIDRFNGKYYQCILNHEKGNYDGVKHYHKIVDAFYLPEEGSCYGGLGVTFELDGKYKHFYGVSEEHIHDNMEEK